MEINDDLNCCGVHELVGIGRQSPEKFLEELVGENIRHTTGGKSRHFDWLLGTYSDRETPLKVTYSPRCAFYIFTQAGRRAAYGKRLRDYIHSQKLGTVVTSPTKVNPNSKNPVTVFTWAFDLKRLIKWYENRKVTHETD